VFLIVMPRVGGAPVRRGLSVDYFRFWILDRPVEPGDDSGDSWQAPMTMRAPGWTIAKTKKPGGARPW